MGELELPVVHLVGLRVVDHDLGSVHHVHHDLRVVAMEGLAWVHPSAALAFA